MTRLLSCFLFFLFLSCTSHRSEKKIASSNEGWVHDSTIHFRLHAQVEARSKDNLAVIGQKLEAVQRELLALLKETNSVNLDLYFLKDRETLTSYTGFPANGYTDTDKGIIYFVDKAPFHLALRHETMHALSWRLWQPPHGYWLSEGIAVYASGQCGGYDLHTLARALAKEHKIVPTQTLEKNFDFRALEPSLQSASLIKFIYERWGVAALKGFWQKGLRNAKEIIGISGSELEKQWLEFIAQEKFDAVIDWKAIMESGCE